MLRAAEAGWLDPPKSESPQFIGRVIAAVSGDARPMERRGTAVVAAEAAAELGVTDTDGGRRGYSPSQRSDVRSAESSRPRREVSTLQIDPWC